MSKAADLGILGRHASCLAGAGKRCSRSLDHEQSGHWPHPAPVIGTSRSGVDVVC
jgi:hypothetical protein